MIIRQLNALLTEPSWYAAYGAYGIGENIGAALSGVTAGAIYNATGKWVLDYPTTRRGY
jgi:CO/xanthine dehydrogenase Mo-binding subunit